MRLTVIAAVFLTLSSAPVFADEVTQRMDGAKRLYEDGKLIESVRELESAIGEIQQRLSTRLGSKMPPAPSAP